MFKGIVLGSRRRRAWPITRRYDDLAHALDEQLGLQPTREPYRQLLGQS
jgi:hypothetical protein